MLLNRIILIQQDNEVDTAVDHMQEHKQVHLHFHQTLKVILNPTLISIHNFKSL